MDNSIKMEVFEIKHTGPKRQSSIGPAPGSSKMPYLLAIVGITLVTSSVLLILHSLLAHKEITKVNMALNELNSGALESHMCDEEFCDSNDCVYLASRISEYLNLEADPCNDFYEFSCGGYRRSRYIPYGSKFRRPAIGDQLQTHSYIREIMEKPSSENGSKTMEKVKQFYKTCVNKDRRLEQQKQSLKDFFSDIELSLDDNHSDHEMNLHSPGSWKKLVARLEEFRIHTVLKPSFIGSADVPIEKIEVDCITPLLHPNVYLDPSDVNNNYLLFIYKELINSLLQQLSLDEGRRKEFLNDILQMETDIARAIHQSESSNNSMLSPETIQELKEIWKIMIGEGIEYVEVVSSCPYNLQNMLQVLNNAPPKMATSYVIWRMLFQLTKYFARDSPFLHLEYAVLFPIWDRIFDSTWFECAAFVREEFGLVVLTALVDDNQLQVERIQQIKKHFVEVKRNFLPVFRSANSVFRKFSTNKIKNMKLNLKFPEVVRNSEVLDDIFLDLQFEDNFLHNILNLKKFKTRHFFTRLWYANTETPSTKISLEANPLGDSSSYEYTTNTVHIDAGLLILPINFYLEDTPKYLKYGELCLLSREMSHAFDTKGCFYDAHGKLLHKNWCSEILEENYTSSKECLRNQVSSIENYDTLEADTSKLLDDAIADIGTFLLQYRALSTHLGARNSEKILPGLNFTRKQTYYIQVAQKYCELRDSSAKQYYDSPLSPRHRVNLAVSNIEDFADTFNCRPESNLFPKHKCNIFL